MSLFVFHQARGRESMVAGFYHVGYEDPLLMLMRRRTVHAGLVVKVSIFFPFSHAMRV